MIEYLETSIFDSPSRNLVNPVNCVGIMGKGLAKQFKLKFPEILKPYNQEYKDGLLKIGRLSWNEELIDGHKIINFPTKKHWRNPSKIEYIKRGLITFNTCLWELGIEDVAFPKLGCGLGGLNWEIQVKPLFERYLSNLDITVYVHI